MSARPDHESRYHDAFPRSTIYPGSFYPTGTVTFWRLGRNLEFFRPDLSDAGALLLSPCLPGMYLESRACMNIIILSPLCAAGCFTVLSIYNRPRSSYGPYYGS